MTIAPLFVVPDSRQGSSEIQMEDFGFAFNANVLFARVKSLVIQQMMMMYIMVAMVVMMLKML